MYILQLEGIECYAYHGVGPEERSVGHRYLLDVILHIRGQADKSDEIADTVDYSSLGALLVDHTRQKQFHLLERLANHLATVALERFTLIDAITVKVSKIAPPCDLVLDKASVEITLARTDLGE